MLKQVVHTVITWRRIVNLFIPFEKRHCSISTNAEKAAPFPQMETK
jgi:hypothetical protein